MRVGWGGGHTCAQEGLNDAFHTGFWVSFLAVCLHLFTQHPVTSYSHVGPVYGWGLENSQCTQKLRFTPSGSTRMGFPVLCRAMGRGVAPSLWGTDTHQEIAFPRQTAVRNCEETDTGWHWPREDPMFPFNNSWQCLSFCLLPTQDRNPLVLLLSSFSLLFDSDEEIPEQGLSPGPFRQSKPIHASTPVDGAFKLRPRSPFEHGQGYSHSKQGGTVQCSGP